MSRALLQVAADFEEASRSCSGGVRAENVKVIPVPKHCDWPISWLPQAGARCTWHVKNVPQALIDKDDLDSARQIKNQNQFASFPCLLSLKKEGARLHELSPL